MGVILPFCEDGEATLHSFKDDHLGFALGWKYNNESGIRTYDGQIILSEDTGLHGWPSSLGEIPSDTELKEICDNYRVEFNNLAYARKRKEEYPSIKDQLDMQYHDEIDGTTTWKDAVAKVKADNTKPE